MVAVGACSSNGGGSDTVTIGFTGPLSGGAALYGSNVLDGLQLAAADINAAGGMPAGGRRVKLEIVTLDDKYFPNESATNAKRLVHQSGDADRVLPAQRRHPRHPGLQRDAAPNFIIGGYTSEPQVLESDNPLTLMIPPRYTSTSTRSRKR